VASRSSAIHCPSGWFVSAVWQALAWALAILAIFFPLAVALYQRRTTI
jgi:hypothetical protein